MYVPLYIRQLSQRPGGVIVVTLDQAPQRIQCILLRMYETHVERPLAGDPTTGGLCRQRAWTHDLASNEDCQAAPCVTVYTPRAIST